MTASYATDPLLHVEQTGSEREVGELRSIPVKAIQPNPNQPRQHFDPEALDTLGASLKRHGFIQPIVVRPGDTADVFVLVAGERRWRAACEAGFAEVPALVRDMTVVEGWVAALIENVDRANLNPVEEGQAYKSLLEGLNLTQERLAERIGVSRRRISQAVLLPDLPEPVRNKCAAGVITFGHARALCGLRDPGQQVRLADRIVAEGWTVRDTELAVTVGNLQGAEPEPKKRRSGPRTPRQRLSRVSASLGEALETQVQVLPPRGKSRGRLAIDFADYDDLVRVLARFGAVRVPDEDLRLDVEDASLAKPRVLPQRRVDAHPASDDDRI